MRNLTLRLMLLGAAVIIVAIPFNAQAQGNSKDKANNAQATTQQTPASGASCPMASRMGAGGDMMKNMPMGGDMMKNMPMSDMMKNMPMSDMMKNMPMSNMMKNMPMGGMMGNQPSTPGTKKP